MQTKLTLQLNSNVIQAAKEYAQEQGESLSKLTERLYRAIFSAEKLGGKQEVEITPFVRKISGIAKADPKTDWEEKYTKYLMEKYK